MQDLSSPAFKQQSTQESGRISGGCDVLSGGFPEGRIEMTQNDSK